MKKNHSVFAKLLNILLLLIGASCTHRVSGFRQATLRSWSSDQRVKSSLNIPRKCHCSFHVEENAIEKLYMYKDSSFIFIRKGNPGVFPKEAIEKYGTDLPLKFTYVEDTITIHGTDKIGKYWEIRNKNYFIYGYERVPGSKKKIFDSALNSISIQAMSGNSRENRKFIKFPDL